MHDQNIDREIGDAWRETVDAFPIPPKHRRLRCGCRQQYQHTVAPYWWTYSRCPRHDLLDDLATGWRYATPALKIAAGSMVLGTLVVSILFAIFAWGFSQ